MKNKPVEITKKIKQLSGTQVGVSLTKEDREILDVELKDNVKVRKDE